MITSSALFIMLPTTEASQINPILLQSQISLKDLFGLLSRLAQLLYDIRRDLNDKRIQKIKVRFMTQHWICATHPLNLVIVLRDGVWGVEDEGRIIGVHEGGPTREIFSQHVNIGDRLFFYTKGEYLIHGLYEVVSKAYRDTTIKWPDGTYPNRVKIRKAALERPTHPVRISSPSLLKQLSFVKNQSHWGTYFQCSMRLVTKEDCRFLLQLISSHI